MKTPIPSIQHTFINNMIGIALVSIGLLTLLWIHGEYSDFRSEAETLRKEYVDAQKKMLYREVHNVVDYIYYVKHLGEEKYKAGIKENAYRAYAIAESIYTQNVDKKSPFEIQKIILNALRPIRFHHERGYEFILDAAGVAKPYIHLMGSADEMNPTPAQKTDDEHVAFERFIELVRAQGEGFYAYTKPRPDSADQDSTPDSTRIVFVKLFEPYQWIIVASGCMDDVTDQIQSEVLQRIVDLRFEEDGYFFGSIYGGKPLFTNGRITRGTGNIWDLSDPNGVKIFQAQQKAAENPEGDYVFYVWHKINMSTPSPKISFVMGIPEWKWIIGAGAHIDSIESRIESNKLKLKEKLVNKMLKSVILLCLLLI